MGKIREKMGNSMPVERVMEPNRKSMDNYWDMQTITLNMKPKVFSSGLLLYDHNLIKFEM